MAGCCSGGDAVHRIESFEAIRHNGGECVELAAVEELTAGVSLRNNLGEGVVGHGERKRFGRCGWASLCQC
jgi:hypothetical protein